MSLLTKIKRELDDQIYTTVKLAKFRFRIWMLRQTMGYVPYDFSGKKWTLTKRLSVIGALYIRRLSSAKRDLLQSSKMAGEFLSGFFRTTRT